MLPATLTAKSLKGGLIAAALSLSLAMPSPSYALNRHEQGIVAGALGVLFLQGMIQASKQPPRAEPSPAPRATAPVVYVPRTTHSPASYAFSSYSRGERRAIQRRLARAGYYYGPIDGAFGPATYQATLDYARDTQSARALNSQAGAYGVYDSLLYTR